MFIVDRDSYVRAAAGAMLTGKPFVTLVDACRRQAAEEATAKIVNLDDFRARLRPPATIATER
jgi:hypothetical protein